MASSSALVEIELWDGKIEFEGAGASKARPAAPMVAAE